MVVTTLHDKIAGTGIGGKAKNLARLQELGIPVPKWAAIPQEVLLGQLPKNLTVNNAQAAFQALVVPAEIINGLRHYSIQGCRPKLTRCAHLPLTKTGHNIPLPANTIPTFMFRFLP
ncbi:MAG: hypothetical protein HC896_13500 [Bacteroidales bacterium]|nr:hypothetical protein [Bacteroidales bacterium]